MKRHSFLSHTPAEKRHLSNLGHIVEGLLLLIMVYPRHPLSDWPQIRRDAQQREHTLMAAAVSISGTAELLRGNFPVPGLVWPAALLLIGSLFLFPAQHGTSEAAARAARQHSILGITIAAAGLLRLVELLRGEGGLNVCWPIVLLAATTLILICSEPEAAFEPGNGHGGHG